MNSSSKRVLFIVTSADHIGPNNRPTGYEFSEVAHPFLTFAADGHRVDFASLTGGKPPEDGFDSNDSASVAFRNGAGFERLNRSMSLENVDLSNYDAIFFPGGLGPMADMLHEPKVKQAIVDVYESGGVVGAVCHGPVALMNVTMSDGTNFLNGKHVAAFTEAEEQGYSEKDVPFMLDAALIEQGAYHTHASKFEEHVVVDGRLITGQNPASATGVASAIIKVLSAVRISSNQASETVATR
ncbi:MAG: putative intracellular protease/amidase [Planctomycetota bacterium]|jgi:putative intracellular protease/amidase